MPAPAPSPSPSPSSSPSPLPARRDPVVVIGAGLGGLSAALHLLGAGHDVVVLEREPIPGGRAGQLREAGYTFDTGPSVLTMPELIADCFAAVGEDLGAWLTLTPLDPIYRAQFADGSQIDVHSDADQMAAHVREVCGPASATGYLRYVAFLRELYAAEMPNFIDRDVTSPLRLVNASMLRLLRLGGLRRLAPLVASYLPDERLQRLFSFQALYAGLAPERALALYAVISYMDSVNGVFAPTGGMHAVPVALAAAAERHGAEIRYATTAVHVESQGGRASAVITADDERIPCSAVVVNADQPGSSALFAPGDRPRSRRIRYAPSCVVLHVGSRRALPPDAAQHTISFGAAWRETFTEIIDRGEVMSDPSVLISAPSVSEPTLSPPGRSTRFVLFPTPNLDHPSPIDWDRTGPAYQEHMLKTLRDRGFTGFDEGDLDVTHLVTPADWQRAGLSAGTPFAAAHTFTQTGPFRSAMPHPTLDNVVFCGAHTQPGVGVPMVLVSGRLAAARVSASLRPT